MLVLVLFAAQPIGLALPTPLPLLIVCQFVRGFAVEFYFIYWLSALQTQIPDRSLGKVLAIDQLSAFALLPVGYLLVPVAVAALGQSGTLLVAGAVVIVSTLTALCVRGVPQFATVTRNNAHDPDRSPG
ncbi:hypothetical protein [Tsukamurella paurometabola]|uniref:Major facilitator superfamily MFS_1 n=1 Tax=Tsukamurella paurometabola TaxID=2061 RepID=A0ABS5NJ22_TSUPA|nr:hypothetical protein [Tsukamurella paurometabola]MBS4104005.1 hypothetical protein [Tsukamurella paurometabola]